MYRRPGLRITLCSIRCPLWEHRPKPPMPTGTGAEVPRHKGRGRRHRQLGRVGLAAQGLRRRLRRGRCPVGAPLRRVARVARELAQRLEVVRHDLLTRVLLDGRYRVVLAYERVLCDRAHVTPDGAADLGERQ
eukprot:scaffold32458_cov59-Phaeocystis_antarctica.AAC.4